MSFRKQISDLELSAAKQAKKLSKLQKSAIAQLQNEVVSKVIEVAAIQAQGPTIFLLQKKVELTNLVSKQFSGLSEAQINQVSDHLIGVYNKSRVSVSSALGKTFDVTNQFQAKELLNRANDGLTLSARIWGNNNAIAERVNNDIARLLYNQANPTDITRAIANDYKISYNAADRLIRTETSRFYNNATIDSYKDAGVEEVEFLAEADACEEQCQPNDGKIFPIGDNSTIPPLHPNCRCALLPVIKK